MENNFNELNNLPEEAQPAQEQPAVIPEEAEMIPEQTEVIPEQTEVIPEQAFDPIAFEQEQPPPAKPTRRKGKFSTVFAAVMSVIILGGASGFGGAYVWGEYFASRPPVVDRSKAPLLSEDDSSIGLDVLSDTHTISPNNNVMDAVELYKAVNDSVVGIKCAYELRYGTGEASVVGSGVIYTTDGFIITCHHVIEGAAKIYVLVDDYDDPEIVHEYEAVVVGSDLYTDLAVLKIERKEEFKAAAIGSSGGLEVGQDVCAIGNPVGLMKTLTKGIVSGLQRDLGEGTYELPSIQTDAALNMGNSGCPLFDMSGNVVGIVNKKLLYGDQIDNLGFAISVDEAKPIINDLVKNGTITTRAMLGIRAQEIDAYNAAMLGVDVASGLYVQSVSEGTPAASSGLTRGDVIIKIDGKDVASVGDVQMILKDKTVGDEVNVTVIRYNSLGVSEELIITFALAASS